MKSLRTRLAAVALGFAALVGLGVALLAARDAGIKEAREALLAIDRPKSATPQG